MRLMHSARGFAMLMTLALAACAGGGSGGSEGARAPGSSGSRIVQAELEGVQQLDALAAVRRLRPRWLRSRSQATPQVHIDGNFQAGGVEALRLLKVSDVQEMNHMSASDATTRFGTNYVGGVILVTTKR